MSTMERILRLMAEKKASDVYLSANCQALIRINGECLPINSQLLSPDTPRDLIAEILVNTQLVGELIEKGDFTGVREAMEKSITPGTQTFDQDLVRLITEGRVTQEDAVSYADSPTNLLWRLQNEPKLAAGAKAGAKDKTPASDDKPGDESPSFTHITLDVRT